MRVVSNRLIPFKGFLAINLFGVLFVRRENAELVDDRIINHELIHTAQMKELGYVGFYLIYFLEWLVRLVIDRKNAYHSISFEREAYYWERSGMYLSQRRHFAQWR